MIQNRALVIVKLRVPNRAKQQKLEGLQIVFNLAVDVGMQAVIKSAVSRPGEIHALVYPLARQSGLPSMYARLVVNEVTALKRQFQRKGHTIPHKRGGLGLPVNSYRLINKYGHWAIRISLGEHGEPLWLPLHVPEKLTHRLEKAQGDARLFQRKGDWYAAFPFRLDGEASTPVSTDALTVTGVDLGIVRLVTAFTDGQVHIIRGAALVQRRKELISRQHEMAQKQRPQQVARLKLLEQRWEGSINHNIASQLVNMAVSRENPVIALENLDGLLYRKHRSQRFSQMRLAWDFRQLIDLIAYMAHEKNVQVVFVDPRGTSTTCPRCHLNSPGNASVKGHFSCQRCGYTSITDIVAAINIAARCVQA